MKFITTFIRQLRRWNEIENRKCDKIQTKKSKIQQNTDKKNVRISFVCGCKCVSVCGCVCMCVRVDACLIYIYISSVDRTTMDVVLSTLVLRF